MPLRASFRASAWRCLTLWAAVLLISGTGWSQTTLSVTPSSTPEVAAVRSVLDQGQQLESEHRWGEALTLYEEALRENPGETSLFQRFEFAKIHYDLGRRYGDGSYTKSLASLTERDALAMYAEILLKIQSHYVDEPNWKRLVDQGSKTLSVALGDDAFVNRHLPSVPAGRIGQFRRDVETKVTAFAIRNRTEARDAVAWAARFGQEQIGLPTNATIFEYLCGATNLLDDYSSYLTADQLTEVYSQIEGNFVGLGIELKAADGALQILRVISGSPAERGGIKSGDLIVAVDGHSTKSMNTDQAANLLQGLEGTLIEVNVATAGQPARTLRLRREHVEVPSVDEIKIIDQEFGIGYLRLTCFQKTTSRDLDAALWKLHKLGMKSLIMDLRGNPGGLLSSSVEVVDKFVSTGRIVSTRGRSPQEDYNYSAHAAGTWQVPLVVLIDGDSASASEIFAGAIRDHQRGKIVGARSYGKGSVQGIFPLGVGSAGVRLTTAKFFSPNGYPFSKVGVAPDVVVREVAKPTGETIAAPSSNPDDAVVAAGLREARGRSVTRRPATAAGGL